MSIQFVSVADVREFLQKADGDERQDAIIGTLIQCASKAIETYTEREFAPATDDEDRQFYYGGKGVLSLTPYDLRKLTSIKIDTVDGAGGSSLTSDQYRLFPKPNRDGVYSWLRISAAATSGTFCEREVTISGDWGFAEVPDDVQQWTKVTVAEWLRRDVAAFSTTFVIDEGRLERPEALPAAVRGGLNRYKMLVV